MTVPATDRQKEYARELGINFAPEIDRTAISKLIDEAVEKRDMERYTRLDELQRREQEAEDKLRLSDATTDQILEALEKRGMPAILVTMDNKGNPIDYEDLVGVQIRIQSTDDMSESDMENVCITIAWKFMQKRTG